MAPKKRTTRASPATTTTTTPVTNAQLKALIDQGVVDALATRDADRSRNGDDSNNSGTGVVGLTQWFERMETVFNISNCAVENQELALLYERMFPKESDKIEKYVGGLPDIIGVKFKDTSRNNQNQQQQNKRQNTDRAYTAGPGEKKLYGESKPLYSKCNYHYDDLCAPKCHKCQKATCFECRAQGHFKREFPKLKNNNRGNQGRNGNAPTKVYAVGHVGTNPDSNVVTGTFLLNNCYASILFDTGADRSFVSTAFSS
ncbi:reverse transcriptase domain-containing protein [Tanacetum coccineum]